MGLEQVTVNVDRMLDVFREGIENLRDIWIEVLGSRGFPGHGGASQKVEQGIQFPSGLWTRSVYDYAIAFHKKKLPVKHLIKSLTPLYLGKTASFVKEVADEGPVEAEQEIEKLCIVFRGEQGVSHQELELTGQCVPRSPCGTRLQLRMPASPSRRDTGGSTMGSFFQLIFDPLKEVYLKFINFVPNLLAMAIVI